MQAIVLLFKPKRGIECCVYDRDDYVGANEYRAALCSWRHWSTARGANRR